ncbi:hypothetical protein FF096_11845 [Micromonospora sp. CP22]|nr:hypothetical protein [Micromonospora sp. CP22]
MPPPPADCASSALTRLMPGTRTLARAGFAAPASRSGEAASRCPGTLAFPVTAAAAAGPAATLPSTAAGPATAPPATAAGPATAPPVTAAGAAATAPPAAAAGAATAPPATGSAVAVAR